MSKLKDEQVKLTATEDGIHLCGEILWFDSQHHGALSFISSAYEKLRNISASQVITTPETFKILSAAGCQLTPLSCPYNRHFSIGRLGLELLPSGHMLGGSSLFVEIQDQKILYAPYLQLQETFVARKAQLKKAGTLILKASDPLSSTSGAFRRKEIDRLLLSLKTAFKQDGYWPMVLCRGVGIAQEITRFLNQNEIPISLHPQIYRVHRVYEQAEVSLGNYDCYSQKTEKNNVIIFPIPVSNRHSFPNLKSRKVFALTNSQQEYLGGIDPKLVDEFFTINSSTQGSQLLEVIEEVQAETTYFFGPFAKNYADFFQNKGFQTKSLFSDFQPTLF